MFRGTYTIWFTIVHIRIRTFFACVAPDVVGVYNISGDNVYNFYNICFDTLVLKGSNWQYASIGSDYGLAPSRHQVIIWTTGGIIY